MPSVWTHWAIVLASALFAAAVEGAIVVVCVALVLNFFPRIPASVRSLMWFSVFGLLLILPVLSGLHGSASRVATGVHTLRIGSAWAFALVGIWSGMVLLRVVELVRSAALLHGIWRRAEPLGAMQSAVTMHVWASDEVRVPSVIGFFAPRIVIPKALIGHLGEEELRAIVLHEAEHLRRRDDWTNLIQKIGIAIFPIHPALLWVERQLCREREVACDDGVLRITGAPRVYAATLANLAEFSLFRRHLSLALGAPSNHHSHTSHRRDLAPCDCSRAQRSRDPHAPKTWGMVCGAGSKGNGTIDHALIVCICPSENVSQEPLASIVGSWQKTYAKSRRRICVNPSNAGKAL
jgi:Zn-dependent protease with chaperone function